MSKVKLSQFDLYGTFRLSDEETAGIADLVYRLNGSTYFPEYLSRSGSYYPQRHPDPHEPLYLRDLYEEYARLNAMLPMTGKPAFVVCEKMHELATRAVNTIQQKHQMHLFQDGTHFDTIAQQCAQECADNLVRLIHDETAVPTTVELRDETRLSPNTPFDRRVIFADNKKQLYQCANALPDDIEHLITPGRGSSKLGTLVQAVRQRKGLKPLGFTQINYSLYGNDQWDDDFVNPPRNLPEKVFVMDDIIFNGFTLARLKKALTAQGHQVTNGALSSSFGDCYDARAIYGKRNWADYIDIIPNQYSCPSSDQERLRNCLHSDYWNLSDILHSRRNGSPYQTADYIAMRLAEKSAAELGADLYQVSEKISPAAVEYNQKIREQIKEYEAEL